MSYSWAQIEIRAAQFSREWADAAYEKGETQSFYNDFFDIFGVKRRSVARYEEHVRMLNNKSGFIDLFWPSVLLVEQKSAGKDLGKAAKRAGEYFDALKEEEKPRYQLVCDFQSFQLIDRDDQSSIDFALADLYKNIKSFAFILGREAPQYRVREPLNIIASDHIAGIYRRLTSSGYPEDQVEMLLTRIVFCLFADNTGIFQPRGCFLDLLEARTSDDGFDLGTWLSHLFQVLDTPVEQRQNHLNADLAQFPFINGRLFSETIRIASFDAQMRRDLLEACRFNWSEISPAIFGSLFQSILNKEERRELGWYGTTERNILKVVDDLFLDQLKTEFRQISTSRANKLEALKRFQRKLGGLTFFDPACGCGNFLSISYRELRKLELAVLSEIGDLCELDLQSPGLSCVDVDHFFGIDQRSYSVRIAETAMWMTDHTANNELSLKFGVEYTRVPLEKAPRIVVGDALKINWPDVITPEKCTYILGNPPYSGSKPQTERRRQQIRELARVRGTGGTLDYVCGWILKAAEYGSAGTRIGLVATNSITHGEQTGQLWPILFERYSLEISFAHQSFVWGPNEGGGPQVQVVIIGLDHESRTPKEKRLYEYETATAQPNQTLCHKISPYLIIGDRLRDSHVVVKETGKPINGFKRLRTGTKPIDGGYYILTEEEKAGLLQAEPNAMRFIRPFVGSDEFIKGRTRYILVLKDAAPRDLRSLPRVMDLISKVGQYRNARIKNKAGTRKLKTPSDLRDSPTKFHISAIPDRPFLVIPEVTSERRQYVPIAWLEPPTVPSNLVKYLADATLIDFALLTSAMHMSWLRHVGGRLEGRYRYSIQVVYNTFPVPKVGEANFAKLEPLARAVLDARMRQQGQALEDLYDPEVMPEELRRAHRLLDNEIDRMYLGREAINDQDRLEHLLNRYHGMIGDSG